MTVHLLLVISSEARNLSCFPEAGVALTEPLLRFGAPLDRGLTSHCGSMIGMIIMIALTPDDEGCALREEAGDRTSSPGEEFPKGMAAVGSLVPQRRFRGMTRAGGILYAGID
jgi:hypothetical protein